MANSNGWGDGVLNNNIGWGQGSDNNDIGWGSIYGTSNSGLTALEIGFSGLLDEYGGASAAYSLRQLSINYTGSAINVRRSSDNATQDIGFDGYVLDTASLLSFVGANDGYVTTWYDQSGNGLDVTNTTAASQPQIVSSGSIITDNGLPAVNFDGVDDRLFRNGMFINKDTLNVFSVQKFNSIVDTTQMSLCISEGSGGRQVYFPYRTSTGFQFWYNDGNVVTASVTADTNRHLFSMVNDGNNGNFYNNGSAFGPALVNHSVVSLGAFHIGSYTNGSVNANVKHQELVIWNVDQSSNRTAIESLINSYYSIY